MSALLMSHAVLVTVCRSIPPNDTGMAPLLHQLVSCVQSSFCPLLRAAEAGKVACRVASTLEHSGIYKSPEVSKHGLV